MTETELREAYYRFCAANDWPPLFRDFAKQSENLIGKYFQILQSHDVKREGKNQRGYHDLRRRQPDDFEPEN